MGTNLRKSCLKDVLLSGCGLAIGAHVVVSGVGGVPFVLVKGPVAFHLGTETGRERCVGTRREEVTK